jgi:hypothetical protein
VVADCTEPEKNLEQDLMDECKKNLPDYAQPAKIGGGRNPGLK